MRAELSAHFDVIVVAWVLALAMAWCCFAVSRAQLSADPWAAADHNGPAWMYQDPNADN